MLVLVFLLVCMANGEPVQMNLSPRYFSSVMLSATVNVSSYIPKSYGSGGVYMPGSMLWVRNVGKSPVLLQASDGDTVEPALPGMGLYVQETIHLVLIEDGVWRVISRVQGKHSFTW